MESGIDGEDIKKNDQKYARQVEALAKLCEGQLNAGFRCNPSRAMAIAIESIRLYGGGPYVLDNRMRAISARPLMLGRSEHVQTARTPTIETDYSHAVLVRLPTEEEEEQQTGLLTEPLSAGQFLSCLELLRFVKISGGVTWFEATGIKEFYS